MIKQLMLTASILLFFSSISIGRAHAAQTSSDVIASAKQYIGVPYHYSGTTPSGFDCSGFTQYVFGKQGVNLPRTTSEQYRVGKAVSKSDLKTGDLVFFATVNSGPSHVGIYINNGEFIHASSSRGITISNINSPYYWKPRYLGARRVLKEEQPPLPADHYYDVAKDYWAYSQILDLSKEGIINGHKNGTFSPDQTVTRAQAAILLTKALHLKTTSAKVSYPDVSNTYWAKDAIDAVTQAGIFHGDTKGYFHPDKPITRAQIAIVLANGFNLQKTAQADQKSQVFADVKPTMYAYPAITSLAANNITSGHADHTFGPYDDTTRAQFSVLLYNALNK